MQAVVSRLLLQLPAGLQIVVAAERLVGLAAPHQLLLARACGAPREGGWVRTRAPLPRALSRQLDDAVGPGEELCELHGQGREPHQPGLCWGCGQRGGCNG